MIVPRLRFVCHLFCFLFLAGPSFAADRDRVAEGLVVLYDFANSDGNMVFDRAKSNNPIHLKINNTKSVRRRDSKLIVLSNVVIASRDSATKLTQTIRKSNALTIEAWITPANTSQQGPSRIVSLSLDTNQRSFTLGQERDRFDVRLRTNSTDQNGMPSLATPNGSLTTKLTHVVFARDSAGRASIFIDGKSRTSSNVQGNLSNWNDQFRLGIANEMTGDRFWKGQFHLVAIYDRALTKKEIEQNYLAGKDATHASTVRVAAKDPKADRIAVRMSTPDIVRPVTLPGGVKLTSIDFERHVMGVIGRVGCNGGSCHGSFQGRGGFRLSLFSYDFERDFEALTERIDTGNPAESYLLEKPTLQEEHGGGLRLTPQTWQYEVIKQWIAAGGEREPGSGTIREIAAVPSECHFSRPGQTRLLKVMATFSDGTTENITPFCDFQLNDDFVAEITPSGKVTGLRAGDSAIVIKYRDHVLTARALVTAPMNPTVRQVKVAPVSYVDDHVLAKLRKLNIAPSKPVTDNDFLRRVYIDTIGHLPTPGVARQFIADKDPKKRNKVIDELLDHSLHSALWATKLSDITGNNTAALEQSGEKRSKMWHDWLRKRLAENRPYTDIVRGVLCATSREGDDPDAWIKSLTSIDEAALTSFETSYAHRETLDLFWTRRNLNLEQMGEQTAAAFLGVRLQCAQCHKHPYDRWSQEDYRAYANIFGQVKFGASSEAKKQIDQENNRRKKIKDKKKKLPSIREVFLDEKNPRRLNHPTNNQRLAAKTLGGPELEMNGDAREKLFDWLAQSDNPYLARSFVNRIWEHYFGIGIVDPVDDFSVANPPSNDSLIDALAQDFIDHNYDIRHIERTILRSRTYQTSSEPNDSNRHDRRNFSRSYPRRMMAEVVVDVINSALATNDRFDRDAPEGSQAIEVAASRVQDGNLRYAFRIFGRPARTAACDCERSSDASLPQTLYLMTDNNIMRKIQDGRLKTLLAQNDRLKKLRNKEAADDELEQIINELFLATFTRFPDPAEQQTAMSHIIECDDPQKAFTDVVWALINSREFILNH